MERGGPALLITSFRGNIPFLEKKAIFSERHPGRRKRGGRGRPDSRKGQREGFPRREKVPGGKGKKGRSPTVHISSLGAGKTMWQELKLGGVGLLAEQKEDRSWDGKGRSTSFPHRTLGEE